MPDSPSTGSSTDTPAARAVTSRAKRLLDLAADDIFDLSLLDEVYADDPDLKS